MPPKGGIGRRETSPEWHKNTNEFHYSKRCGQTLNPPELKTSRQEGERRER